MHSLQPTASVAKPPMEQSLPSQSTSSQMILSVGDGDVSDLDVIGITGGVTGSPLLVVGGVRPSKFWVDRTDTCCVGKGGVDAGGMKVGPTERSTQTL